MTFEGAKNNELVYMLQPKGRQGYSEWSPMESQLKHQWCRKMGWARSDFWVTGGGHKGGDHTLKSQVNVQISSPQKFLAQTQEVRISLSIGSQAQIITTTILEANVMADSQLLRSFFFFNCKDSCVKGGPRILNEIRKLIKPKIPN